MARPYYVLFSRTDSEAPWGVEFGSYVKSEVKFERQTLHEGYLAIKMSDMSIVQCLDSTQSTIEYQRHIMNKYGKNWVSHDTITTRATYDKQNRTQS